ncbi:MAG: NUDIX domain-containing protein, partial [Erysipelotrichaceae bacterium]|nr:NUDIX domain-containing protein [Erysipelotrichaceae bacterium]
QTKILLIRQYGKADWILVAGYVKADEALEDALHREFHEEIGTCLDQVCYQTSAYYEASNTLMCNFAVVAQDVDLSKCCEWEIDEARWFSFAQAKKAIKPNSLAQRFLFRFLASWEQIRSQL